MNRLLLLLSLALLSSSARAHHGQDFFVTLDTRVPELGHGSVFISGSWAKNSGADETEIDPGFLMGLGGGFAAGSTFQLSNGTPGDFGYAGVTPLLQWSRAVPGTDFRVGASAAYHFADSSHSSSHSSVHYHVIPGGSGGPGTNPDAPPPGTIGQHIHGGGGHSHDGIHRHGEDHFQTRLIGEWQASGRTRVLANFLMVGGGSDDIDFGYALAVRQDLTARLAAGLEVIGDLVSHGLHEAIAGLFYSPTHDVSLRLGAGTGFGPGSTDISIHGGMTWRF
ncbi:hypothetical protein OKA04_15380 [Luteolibacter flavescens]|uniref:Transporter n=1 Tax=Luteolibacter flavescens TaxID=1859460 RepID=A0ABT3FT10_9BACT|nr:hypothetical protein [Luteolibacter flavescens]MCW1886120.1 hypothetical protein [Luteolibacter flavescens]